MRNLLAGIFTLLFISLSAAAGPQPIDLTSTEAVMRWINGYRNNPDARGVPPAMIALGRLGAFSNPERTGVYVGFLAGVLGSNRDKADTIVSQTLAMHSDDHWIIVRAIAYSGLPNWKQLLLKFKTRIPARKAMIDKYLVGTLPRLDQLAIGPAPTSYNRLREHFRIEPAAGSPGRKVVLEPSAEVLDILWGYYFATGSYGPVIRMIELLQWSQDHDDVERLTIGSITKFTLASNATHDQALLAMLRGSSKARNQPKKTVTALNEVTDAAETVDIARIRKQALAAIDEVRRKGPAYKRAVSWWGYVGQTAIAGGCIAAAVTGHVELGIPCVVGGATASAAMNFWANQP